MYEKHFGFREKPFSLTPDPAFLYVGRKGQVAATGSLEDVAPTMLYLMGLRIPSEMSGRSLVVVDAEIRP